MRKKTQFICLFLVFFSMFVGTASADTGTKEIPAGGMISWMWDLKKRGTIHWDITTSEKVNLYISTNEEFNRAIDFKLFQSYERYTDILKSSGSFQVPFSDRWVLFLYNENIFSVDVNYDITISNPSFFFTSRFGLIIIGGVLILFILAVAFRAFTKRSLQKMGASRPIFCESCGERLLPTDKHCPQCRRPVDYSKLIEHHSKR